MGIMVVTNTSPNLEGVLYSHDRDSIHIRPKAVNMKVDDKFRWKMPRHVVEVTNEPLLSMTQEIEPVSNLQEVLEKVQARRALPTGPTTQIDSQTIRVSKHRVNKGRPNSFLR